MKAVILAAGKGTRMREMTRDIPKPMLPVQGRPILDHIVDGLVEAGIDAVCLITGWHAETIENHFGDGSSRGIRIVYARQTILDGTGKAPELAKEFVATDSFLLTYGDILVKAQTYRRMLERFAEAPFSGLVTVTEGEDVTKGGISFFDNRFCLKRLVEKPLPAQLEQLRLDGWLRPDLPVYYNAGIYIFRPDLFEFTARLTRSVRGEYELTQAIEAMVAAGRRIAGLRIEGRWVDVRDPEVLQALAKGED